jgi:hypothetical protein
MEAARKPGDILLDRFMPDASAEERAEALANLKRLLAVLIQIYREHASQDERDSPDMTQGDTIEGGP